MRSFEYRGERLIVRSTDYAQLEMAGRFWLSKVIHVSVDFDGFVFQSSMAIHVSMDFRNNLREKPPRTSTEKAIITLDAGQDW